MKRYIFIFLPLILCVISSCNSNPDYDATGIFEATTIIVSAETSGKIVTMNVAEGDTVDAGSPIAVIDTVMLALQKRQIDVQRQAIESNRPDISAQASALRVQIEHQSVECQRFARLAENGAVSTKTVDDANAALRTLQGQLTSLLSQLNGSSRAIADNALALQTQSDQISEQIIKSTVCSPLTATVLQKFAEAGEFASPGKPLVKIADMSRVYLRAYFTAEQLADLTLGQQVTVTADFGNGKRRQYSGTVTWIAQESEFTPKSIQTSESRANLVYAVKVSVINDGGIKLGQYGEVRL